MAFSETGPGVQFDWLWPDFNGCKLVLIRGDSLLTCLRDDCPDIPFPGHWDLPGGGREGHETPISCALRELHEEFGLNLPPERLRGHVFPSVQAPGMQSWLFTGQITAAEIAAIRFGPEGQRWRMMPLAQFMTHPYAVPHFRAWVRVALDRLAQPSAPAIAARRP